MIIGRFQPSNCVSVSSRAVFTLFILLLIAAMLSLSSTFFDLFCSARSLLLRCISPARNLSRTSNWFPVLSFFLFTESVKHGNTSKHNLEWFRFFIRINVHCCAVFTDGNASIGGKWFIFEIVHTQVNTNFFVTVHYTTFISCCKSSINFNLRYIFELQKSNHRSLFPCWHTNHKWDVEYTQHLMEFTLRVLKYRLYKRSEILLCHLWSRVVDINTAFDPTSRVSEG